MIKPVLSGAEDKVRSAVEGTADWIIGLGSKGGVRGGEIVAEGTPEAVAANARSFTGQYLKPKKEGPGRRRNRERPIL